MDNWHPSIHAMFHPESTSCKLFFVDKIQNLTSDDHSGMQKENALSPQILSKQELLRSSFLTSNLSIWFDGSKFQKTSGPVAEKSRRLQGTKPEGQRGKSNGHIPKERPQTELELQLGHFVSKRLEIKDQAKTMDWERGFFLKDLECVHQLLDYHHSFVCADCLGWFRIDKKRNTCDVFCHL